MSNKYGLAKAEPVTLDLCGTSLELEKRACHAATNLAIGHICKLKHSRLATLSTRDFELHLMLLDERIVTASTASCTSSYTTLCLAITTRPGCLNCERVLNCSTPPPLVLSSYCRTIVDLSTSLLQVRREPFETFIQAISTGSTSCLDEPLSLSERVKSKLVGNFSGVHCVRQILLVCKDEEKCVSEFVLVQHSL